MTDITNINKYECHGYLALLAGAYWKKIIGWSLEEKMNVSMIKVVLTMAHQGTIFKYDSIMHHSNRGKQY